MNQEKTMNQIVPLVSLGSSQNASYMEADGADDEHYDINKWQVFKSLRNHAKKLDIPNIKQLQELAPDQAVKEILNKI